MFAGALELILKLGGGEGRSEPYKIVPTSGGQSPSTPPFAAALFVELSNRPSAKTTQYSQLPSLTTLTPRDSVEQAGKRALVLLGKAFNAIFPDGRQILCELVIAPRHFLELE